MLKLFDCLLICYMSNGLFIGLAFSGLSGVLIYDNVLGFINSKKLNLKQEKISFYGTILAASVGIAAFSFVIPYLIYSNLSATIQSIEFVFLPIVFDIVFLILGVVISVLYYKSYSVELPDSAAFFFPVYSIKWHEKKFLSILGWLPWVLVAVGLFFVLT